MFPDVSGIDSFWKKDGRVYCMYEIHVFRDSEDAIRLSVGLRFRIKKHIPEDIFTDIKTVCSAYGIKANKSTAAQPIVELLPPVSISRDSSSVQRDIESSLERFWNSISIFEHELEDLL